MTITPRDVEEALAQEPSEAEGEYIDRDSLLYAVAIGMSKDPLDEKELEYTCRDCWSACRADRGNVLTKTRGGGGSGRPSLMSKMNFTLMLHGEQRLTIHQPLPRAAEIVASNALTGVYDKGEGKGALVTSETSVRLKSGEPLYTLGSTMFFRGDGGFGGSSEGAPVPHALPDRDPDIVCEMPQREDQAMIYALCGDRNPLHRDPNVAKQAGFDKPILHGLCSYGIACHAVLKSALDYDETRMKGFDVRFSSPVFPGETQVLEAWQDDKVISFRVRIKERDVIAINNGKCMIE
ncbi:MAG: MaoC/PaaZ C-terminal domain-containing protein [Gammaproteobacteria bacterium]|nr:MaoC/PaaZ C-terminal domain-containing protein [Gammaproteobacteria bacterium]